MTAVGVQQQGINGYRTGELIRDILRIEDESFLPLTFGEQLESDIRLENLPDVTLEELSLLSPTVGKDELRTLLAAVELGRRVAEAKAFIPKDRVPIDSPQAAIAYCQDHFRRLLEDGLQEEFHILSLNTKNYVIRSHLVTVGTLDASLVHPREVFRPAIRDSACSIIAVHNHPSGDPTPSKEDRSVTKRLEKSGKTLGIELLDHIIVARDGLVSIRDGRDS